MAIDNLIERYIGFITDFAFKRFFGTDANKDLLIDFLNSLLEGKEKILDLTYKNGECLPEKPVDRKAVFDVYCTTDTGDHFIVEMQNAKQAYFKDRTVYYSTFPIQQQSKKGDWDYKLDRVYSVNIMNFKFDEKSDSQDKDKPKDDEPYRTDAKIVNLKTNKVFYDKLHFVYIELPKFHKKANELKTQLDRWIYAIKYLSEFKNQPPELAGKVFDRLFQIAEIASFTEQEAFEFEESLKEFRDYNNTIKTSFMEGIEKGERETNLKNAKRMRDKGYSLEDISEITGLSIEEIEYL